MLMLKKFQIFSFGVVRLLQCFAHFDHLCVVRYSSNKLSGILMIPHLVHVKSSKFSTPTVYFGTYDDSQSPKFGYQKFRVYNFCVCMLYNEKQAEWIYLVHHSVILNNTVHDITSYRTFFTTSHLQYG